MGQRASKKMSNAPRLNSQALRRAEAAGLSLPETMAADLAIATVTSAVVVIGPDQIPGFCQGMIEAWAAALAHHTSRQIAFDALTRLALVISQQGDARPLN